MSRESREERVLGDFHKSTSGNHPRESIGNQQIWGPGGYQVGAIEFMPNPKTESLDLKVTGPKGDILFGL
jgi:hypothetical protein